MKRQLGRLNATRRRRLYQRDVLIEQNEGPDFAVAVTLRSADWAFPPGSRVVLEVFQHSRMVHRVELGPLKSIQPRKVVKLGDAERTTPPRFRLKVIDDARRPGLILGATRRFLFRDPVSGPKSGTRSILWIKPFDLGDRVWQVKFDQEDMPVLYYNSTLVGFRERLADGKLVSALVLPEVIRRVLERMGRDTAAGAGEQGDWRATWRRWIKDELQVREEAPAVDDFDGGSERALARWTEDVVSAFCRRHDLLKRARRVLERGGWR